MMRQIYVCDNANNTKRREKKANRRHLERPIFLEQTFLGLNLFSLHFGAELEHGVINDWIIPFIGPVVREPCT